MVLRKTVILAWTLFLLVFGSFAPKLPSVLMDHGLFPDGEYARVEQILSSDFRIPKDPVILLFEKKPSVAPQQFRQFIQQTLFQMRGIEGIGRIVSPFQREGMFNGNFTYALLGLKPDSRNIPVTLDDIQRRLAPAAEISVSMTGKPVVQTDVNRASRHDLQKAERIGVAAAFLVIWVAFGTIALALIPIIVGLISVTGTMGIMYLLGTQVELSNFVLNVIPMVGLALSMDFALMIVSRFREEAEKAPLGQALEITMNTAGRAVLLSATCVFLGLTGILWIPLPMFSSIAIGAMIVLTVSVWLTLTLIPALLSVLWPILRSGRKPRPAFAHRKIWDAISAFVLKRPVRMGLLASLFLMGCCLPLSRMRVTVPDATSLPPNEPSRLAFESYEAEFFSPSRSDVYLIVEGPAQKLNKEDWQNAYALVRELKNDPDVQEVDSVFGALRVPPERLYDLMQDTRIKEKYEPVLQPFISDNKMLVRVSLRGAPTSPKVMDWLRLREQEGVSSDIRFLLGGEAKYRQEVFDDIFRSIPYALLFILVSNYAVLFVAFRSLLLPFKTIVMNLLSLGASFGILAWIFEEGLFGMEPGSIAIMIPVFIFGLVFGISMDYGVFLLSRIFEVYRQTRDNDRAVMTGLASTGRIITSAAAIMIAVTVPFAFGEVAGVKQLGIGIAAAIFIDATVIRMVLVPSLMKLLGKWNWWAPRKTP
ncbi:MMPL family transporter [Cohnella zeiphila]|nr:MMPL family transporter [Cohnella zeiphila]